MEVPTISAKIKLQIAANNVAQHTQESFAWELEAMACHAAEDKQGEETAKGKMKLCLAKIKVYQDKIIALQKEVEEENKAALPEKEGK